MLGRKAIELREQLSLHVQLLDDSLDHKVGLAYRLAEVPRQPHTLQRGVGLGTLQPPLLDTPRQMPAIGLLRPVQLLAADVVQSQLDPVQRSLLGDLGAHRARADDRKPRHTLTRRETRCLSASYSPSSRSQLSCSG